MTVDLHHLGEELRKWGEELRLARSPLTSALASLDSAIKLHAAHMDGSEPTSDASQEKLMGLMEDARDALKMHKEEMMM